MISAWRIVGPTRVDTAFSGDGSRRYGGRWNSKGQKAVYAADSLALATLEIMVHAVIYDDLRDYFYIKVKFPEKIVQTPLGKDLPLNWSNDPPPLSCRQFGDRWLDSISAAVLKVPTAVIPHGFNYVFNPDHSDFGQINIQSQRAFFLDDRLIR